MTAKLRCAIYTRKSTEEGLDQAFNTLDAQREACEAYICSQVGEGWRALPQHYDDGGFSGGNLNRPAMQRLLDDVDAGQIDVIVVYKVDRLTRSLMDFAKIVERLDARGVSFVSVTQAFNTTTSMGRLTLNVLLSFAQFEREVTGERIRDKIAASKAKGMWMGGNVPVGYDLADRCLIVNPAEAEQVRHIFQRYLDLRSGVALARELKRDGILSKRWTSRSGKERGGLPLSCGALYYLLQNRIYIGEIVHRGSIHAGTHDPIVSKQLFDDVQEALASNRRKRREQPTRTTQCWLSGIVHDLKGQPMGSTFSYGRGGRLYRYYVSGSLDPNRPADVKAARVPAGPLEKLVSERIGLLLGTTPAEELALSAITRVELHARSIQLVLNAASFLEPGEPIANAIKRLSNPVRPDRLADVNGTLRLIVDRAPSFRGGSKARSDSSMPLAGEEANALSEILRAAHLLLKRHQMSPMDFDSHASATAPAWQRDRQKMMLGLLAPGLQRRILERGIGERGLLQLRSMPLAWSDQLAITG